MFFDKTEIDKIQIDDLSILINFLVKKLEINSKDLISEESFISEFFGFFNPIIRKWIKLGSSKIIQNKKKEDLSFFDLFYTENIDDLNPFERIEKFEIFNEALYKNLKFLKKFEMRNSNSNFSFYLKNNLEQSTGSNNFNFW